MSIAITQKQFIKNLLNREKGKIILGSLGTISNDLEELDNGNNTIIKIRGAMGVILGIGLGYAMNTKKKVIVLVGEGSFLMHLGSIATINKYRPKNLKVVILNNGKYASCGGQKNNYDYLFSDDGKCLSPRIYQVSKVS